MSFQLGDDAMDKTMSPSDKYLTRGQIGKIYDMLVVGLEKAAFPSDPSQQVLEQQGGQFVADVVAAFQKRVESAMNRVIRRANVHRTRTAEQAFVATGRKQYVTESVVATMPRGSGDSVEMEFINLGRRVACSMLDGELASLGYELIIDPIGQASINEADPEFADKYPNATQWKDSDGKFCYASFDHWNGERYVSVDQGGNDWDDSWWFPVRRLPAQAGK